MIPLILDRCAGFEISTQERAPRGTHSLHLAKCVETEEDQIEPQLEIMQTKMSPLEYFE